MKIENYKNFTEAVKTACQTPDAVFHIEIKDKKLSIEIDLPMELDLSEQDAKLLEANVHNALELVLAPYFDKK